MSMKHLITVLIVTTIGLPMSTAWAALNNAFQENEVDANGFYQWNEPNNWYRGVVPDPNYTPKIGTTNNPAVSARLELGPAGSCYKLTIDDADTGPSSLTIKNNTLTTVVQIDVNYASTGGTSLLTVIDSTINGGHQLNMGKYAVDRPGTLDMTGGTLDVTSSMSIGQSGSNGQGAGSSAVLSGVVATIGTGVNVGSSNANNPGLLKLSGTGSLTATSDDTDIYVAAFEIDGGSQTISLDRLRLQSGSDSVLKLSGSGVSTISAVTAVFSNGSILNVDDLSVAENTYKVVDATTSITDNGLAFAPGTDPNAWSFEVDDTNNDLLLTYDTGAPPPVYTLTVNSGDGDGNYEASTVVDITADAPPDGNQTFDIWTGDTANIADTSEPNTTITMPAADAEITATYTSVPVYMLTVNSGDGDGNYYENEVIDITADAPPDGNQIFDIWTGDTANIADTSEPNTTITMPAADAEVTATYTLIGQYTLTVNSGSGDGDYEANTVVDILADDPPVGDIFDVWTGDTANIDDVAEPNTTITMPAANAEITATYVDDPDTYQLTVVSGSGDGYYDPNAVVDITADAPGPSEAFDVWTGDIAYVADVNEPNTTVTMPELDITVTATYSGTPPTYTDFLENEADGNGDYLWSTPNNWTSGLPGSQTQAQIGHSGVVGPVHCVLYDTGATCNGVEIAEAGGTEGSSFLIAEGASLAYSGKILVAKDRLGYLTVNGMLNVTNDADFQSGGPHGDPGFPSKGVVVINSTGTVTADFVGINKQSTNPTEPAHDQARGSSITVNGGTLTFDNGMRISTSEPNQPGLLKLADSASFTCSGGTIEVWAGIWEIEGGNASISTQDILFDANWTFPDANAVLRLSGDGVSTINATFVTIQPKTLLDVLNLNVSDGQYKVIDATSITDNGLAFADGTDTNDWYFNVDDTNGDLILGRGELPGPTYELEVNSGSGDGFYEANTVVDILADNPPVGDTFDVWTGDTAYVDNVNEANTTVTMPAVAVEITATYVDDPNSYMLTVNNGSGDGVYDPNTVADILADMPGLGQIFDVWIGDTAGVDNVDEPNTTYTMPASDAEITAMYTNDPNYVTPPRGYIARACGFDMNHNGTIGEPADATVGDGNTTDPDGDGTDEDLIYVDATDGNDNTGDGSAGNPYKTAKKALDVADGPGDGAEDIVCLAGVFEEWLTFTQSGVAGYYIRDNFQFPNNPFMLIGWDKDGDGEYPPYDTDDEAIFDGNSGLSWAFSNWEEKSYIEIAHLGVRQYHTADATTRGRGVMELAHHKGGTADISHLYVHDVEMENINYHFLPDGLSGSTSNVFKFWVAKSAVTWVGIINDQVDGFAMFFIRGTPANGSGNFRFQNLTLKCKVTDANTTASVAKIWEQHENVEFLDNVFDSQMELYGPYFQGATGIRVRPCARNYTIRNNELVNFNTPLAVTGYSAGFCGTRTTDDILIDRNIIRSTWTFPGFVSGVYVQDGGTLLTETVEDLTITNNFIWLTQTTGNTRGFRSDCGNDGGAQPGTITFAGNTIYGPGSGDLFRGISIWTPNTYPQQNYVIKNNIVANVGPDNRNISTTYAPSGWIANGNIYDDDGNYVWNGTWYGTFAEWQTASGQDANSRTGDPVFVDDANGDLHIDPSDTLVEGAGVDITSITTSDIDGDARSPTTPWAGADVGEEANAPPNNPPVAADDAYSVDEDITLNVSEANGVLANDSDPNDDPITAELVSDVSNGTLTLYSNGSFDYTPNGDWNGVDSFVYKAYDGQDYSNDANAVITVNAVNDPPTADDDAYETPVNTELNVDANNGVLDNDSDPESDPLTAILVTDVSNGTLTLYSSGAFDYTPDANYVGDDMFVYKANDGVADSGDANVVITVSAPTDDYASAESTDRGTVDGNYTDTYSSDDSYEALTEVVQANRSKLEHEWTFSVTGGTSVQFSVEAYKAGTEDDFKFEYSPNGSDWTYMLTVSKTSDDNTPQTFDLPGGTSGTFYIHVLDTNRDNKAKDLDTVYVDHMFIRSE